MRCNDICFFKRTDLYACKKLYFGACDCKISSFTREILIIMERHQQQTIQHSVWMKSEGVDTRRIVTHDVPCDLVISVLWMILSRPSSSAHLAWSHTSSLWLSTMYFTPPISCTYRVYSLLSLADSPLYISSRHVALPSFRAKTSRLYPE